MIVFMLMQFKYQSDLVTNFDEFQDKRYEIVKKQLNSEGTSEYQAHLIASAIRDETRMLKSTVFSGFLMQSYFTMMICLILLSLFVYGFKKDKSSENSEIK
ncbi:MAG TPA: hypothetical protein PKE69_17090 [Pyrinomonadaceae bacterium]|nr:hypothetical protein [Pyrinomonadaceae bacterium]